MNELWEWFEKNNAHVFEVKRQLFSQRHFGVNKKYQVFTIPTQHFYVDSLDELTVERLEQETLRQRTEWEARMANAKKFYDLGGMDP